MQATVKRVDLAYNSFFKGLRKKPKFKSIHKYSGWTYPAKSGWKANTEGEHGTVTLNDLGITVRMRGKAKDWGIPTTLTISYKPSKNQWFASFSVDIEVEAPKFGSESDLKYEKIVAFDLGTATALTLYDGREFAEVKNPQFTKKAELQIKHLSKALRRKRAPNHKKKVKASRRWQKARKQISKLQAKVATQRKDWQHKITSDIASRYDIGVTEELNTKGMTRKAKKGSKREARRMESSTRQTSRKKQKAGLNKSILSVGFGALNQMIAYKIEHKGGLMIVLPTKEIKPSQRCPSCGKVNKEWAELSNRHHVCECGFEIARDRGSAMVMYNVATNQQTGFGTSLADCGCFSTTSGSKKRKQTGSMKHLGQVKRQKRSQVGDGVFFETPSAYAAE
ncbi:transposase [Tolypothrix bouteillei VB521301]|uniref:Transposase n=2 Tax=Nostocales TaxID=1161 RepID=A0A0C1NFD8_9CYAN|nr:transposase [Tolypothrix bouteillei VB521301]